MEDITAIFPRLGFAGQAKGTVPGTITLKEGEVRRFYVPLADVENSQFSFNLGAQGRNMSFFLPYNGWRLDLEDLEGNRLTKGVANIASGVIDPGKVTGGAGSPDYGQEGTPKPSTTVIIEAGTPGIILAIEGGRPTVAVGEDEGQSIDLHYRSTGPRTKIV